ncbi:MAG: DivIVA domain-containing protein [Firmicutes bacterium]|nr:DivIVA domain-containing protein [Bacillota bacterium]
MPITPVDVHNKEFRRSLWGFNEDEVDEFLDELGADYEAVIRERDALREQVESLRQQLMQYKELEDNLQRALVVAQSTAEEVRQSARKESELTIQEAQARAQRILEEAQAKIRALENDQRELEREINVYRARVRSLLQSTMDLIDNFPSRERGAGTE